MQHCVRLLGLQRSVEIDTVLARQPGDIEARREQG
jgi:hypothetical protein